MTNAERAELQDNLRMARSALSLKKYDYADRYLQTAQYIVGQVK